MRALHESVTLEQTVFAAASASALPSEAPARSLRKNHWRDHVRDMLRGINPHLAPTLVLDPITAQQFIDRGGFDTKEKLVQWLHDNAKMPAKMI